MSNKTRDSYSDSACHVLKGAIVKVLNTPLTVSVECVNKVKGRVCVEYTEADKPTDAILARIEEEANNIIKQNLPLNVFTIDRKEAEAKYINAKVNNTYIYDKFPVPETVTSLTLVEIEGWNINCCPAVHLKTTGEIGYIKISGINHRPQKKELEIRFDLLPAGQAPGGKDTKPKVPAKDPLAEKKAVLAATNVNDLTDRIVQLVLANASNPSALNSTTIPEIKVLLSNLKNTSYSNGYNSK
eukprot:gene6262-7263_t